MSEAYHPISIRCTPTTSCAATPDGLRATRAARNAARASAADTQSPVGPCGQVADSHQPSSRRRAVARILPLLSRHTSRR